jgi:hypothetical protein
MDEKSSPNIARVVSMQFALSLQSHLQRWLIFGVPRHRGLVQQPPDGMRMLSRASPIAPRPQLQCSPGRATRRRTQVVTSVVFPKISPRVAMPISLIDLQPCLRVDPRRDPARFAAAPNPKSTSEPPYSVFSVVSLQRSPPIDDPKSRVIARFPSLIRQELLEVGHRRRVVAPCKYSQFRRRRFIPNRYFDRSRSDQDHINSIELQLRRRECDIPSTACLLPT